MIHVRSLAGDIEVPHDAHVCDVLAQLQEGGGTKKQRFRLVHQGKVLNGGGLAEAGVGPADTIVALEMREPAPPVMYGSESPAADLASINAAIAKERADRGQEAEPARHDFAQHRASEFPFLRRMMHQLAALGGLRPSPGGRVSLDPAQVQTLWDTIESCLRASEQLGSDSQAAASGSEPHPVGASSTPLPVADEDALQQLVAMGFPEARSRKALLLKRNSIEAAMEWLLEHGEDPAADTPLTEAQLRALAAPGGATSVVQPDTDALQQLVEMGFDEQQAAEALRATFNDQEAACAYLLGEREVVPPRTLLNFAALHNPRLVAEYRRAAEIAPDQRIQMFRAMLSGPAVSVDPPPGPGEPEGGSRRLLELLNAFRDVQQ